jgi:hypothetical protein
MRAALDAAGSFVGGEVGLVMSSSPFKLVQMPAETGKLSPALFLYEASIYDGRMVLYLPLPS